MTGTRSEASRTLAQVPHTRGVQGHLRSSGLAQLQ